MKSLHLKLAFAVATAGVLVGVGAVAGANGGGGKLDQTLTGYQEVPALSTSGAGEFHATITDALGHEEIAMPATPRAVWKAAQKAQPKMAAE